MIPCIGIISLYLQQAPGDDTNDLNGQKQKYQLLRIKFCFDTLFKFVFLKRGWITVCCRGGKFSDNTLVILSLFFPKAT